MTNGNLIRTLQEQKTDMTGKLSEHIRNAVRPQKEMKKKTG